MAVNCVHTRLTSPSFGPTVAPPMLPSVGAPRVYHHIVAHIERAIYDRTLACGDKLPSERELGRRFGASRVAVREALRALEYRGLLEVRQGSAGRTTARAPPARAV